MSGSCHRGRGPHRPRRCDRRAGHRRAAGVLTDGARRWLDEHSDGADPGQALAFFDSLPPAVPDLLTGRWRGSGLPTGSPLDGLLESYGWYGKEFLDAETVHPLLFRDRSGRPRPVNPAFLPVRLLPRHPRLAHNPLARETFRALRPLLSTNRPRARLRTVAHRGVATAAMVYDALPIIDVFRSGGPDLLVGWMDLRGLAQPFFFVLRRDDVS